MRKGARLSVVAWDRDLKNALATGTLQTVDNLIDASTGTVKMKAVFANRDGALFPNQFVNARLLVDTIDGATIIPSAALQRSAQATFVLVVQQDSTVHTKSVEVRQNEGEEVAVSGLTPGDLVVTEGVDRLQQGAKVNLPKAAKP
jgi:multidrug efflux system membrane fusion protein